MDCFPATKFKITRLYGGHYMASNNKGMTITAIGSIPLIMVLGNSMIIPIFPAMKKALKLYQMQVRLTITVISVSAAIIIPFVGYLSDRYSRKVIIIPSLLLYGDRKSVV